MSIEQTDSAHKIHELHHALPSSLQNFFNEKDGAFIKVVADELANEENGHHGRRDVIATIERYLETPAPERETLANKEMEILPRTGFKRLHVHEKKWPAFSGNGGKAGTHPNLAHHVKGMKRLNETILSKYITPCSKANPDSTKEMHGFLPSDIEDATEIEAKQDTIIRMIEVHDIGEAITGDYTPFDQLMRPSKRESLAFIDPEYQKSAEDKKEDKFCNSYIKKRLEALAMRVIYNMPSNDNHPDFTTNKHEAIEHYEQYKGKGILRDYVKDLDVLQQLEDTLMAEKTLRTETPKGEGNGYHRFLATNGDNHPKAKTPAGVIAQGWAEDNGAKMWRGVRQEIKTPFAVAQYDDMMKEHRSNGFSAAR